MSDALGLGLFPGWEETQWSGPNNPENGPAIRKCPKLTVFGVSVRVAFGVQPPGTHQALRVTHRVRVTPWWDTSPLEWAHGLAKMADRGRVWAFVLEQGGSQIGLRGAVTGDSVSHESHFRVRVIPWRNGNPLEWPENVWFGAKRAVSQLFSLEPKCGSSGGHFQAFQAFSGQTTLFSVISGENCACPAIFRKTQFLPNLTKIALC